MLGLYGISSLVQLQPCCWDASFFWKDATEDEIRSKFGKIGELLSVQIIKVPALANASAVPTKM
eukprot:5339969-Amphidinium_carterae.1